MSLATRCPACGTIFRVVQDQLKVSEGWVRCGQCHEVFNGIEALFDLDANELAAARRAARTPLPPAADDPAPGPPPPAAFAPPAPSPWPPEPPDAPGPPPAPWHAAAPPPGRPVFRPSMAPRFAARLAEETARAQQRLAQGGAASRLGLASPGTDTGWSADTGARAPAAPPPAGPVPTPAPSPLWRDSPAPPPARPLPPAPSTAGPSSDGPRFVDDDEDVDHGPLTLASLLPDASDWHERPQPRSRRARATGPHTAPATAPLSAPPAPDGPRFLRDAHRQARWNRLPVRIALWLSLGVLVPAAAGQIAWPLRDSLAARYPALRPAFDLACAQLGCRIEPPRSLASLALDSSTLTRTGTEHVLLFTADLHNRGELGVRVPSFELSFLDFNGDVVVRKVLTPEQIGIRQAALAPEADVQVHARLQLSGVEASGFHAEMFYP